MLSRLKNLRQGFVLALIATFFTSCFTVLVRYILKSGEDPLNLSAWMILLMILPWLFLFQKHTREFQNLPKKTICLLVFIGIASSLGVNYLQSLALANTSAVNFSFLYRMIVVFTVIFAWLFLKEKMTRQKIVLVLFILVGSFLLTTDGKGIVLTLGDIYSLSMAACAAFISNILVKHTMSKMHPDLSGAVTSIVACISLILLATLLHVFTIPQHVGFVVLASLCYFTMIMLRNRAYKLATASFVTMVFAITPLFVTILSLLFLNETLSLVQAVGGLLIVGSTISAERYKL